MDIKGPLMLPKIVEDICVTNDILFKDILALYHDQHFDINNNQLYFVQAVLHESSLLKENLTALKEEAEVDFFFLWCLHFESYL